MTVIELNYCPTLEAADAALEERESGRERRGYLGFSGIGDCPRKTYYRFYGVSEDGMKASALKNIADGFRTEELVIERLRQVDGLTIIDRDPETGKQIEVSDFDGHALGHLDFEVFGLLQSPKTPHVGEVKCINERSFKEVKKIIAKNGEKAALREWNETYFAQAQMYMLYRGMTRHYCVVATAGGRDWLAMRTEFDRELAEFYAERARQIIFHGEILPSRISEHKDFWKCRWCGFQDLCHDMLLPERNCRTCVYSKPVQNGAWECQRFNVPLDREAQESGCLDQRFKPTFVDGSMLRVDDKKNMIFYTLKNGETWADAGENKPTVA